MNKKRPINVSLVYSKYNLRYFLFFYTFVKGLLGNSFIVTRLTNFFKTYAMRLFRQMLQHSFASQIMTLVSLIMVGAVLSSAISSVILSALGTTYSETELNASLLRLIQFLSVCCVFILPSFIFAHLTSDNAGSFLKTNKAPSVACLLFATAALICIYPLVNLSSYVNQQFSLPSSMSDVEQWLRQLEAYTKELSSALLVSESLSDLFQNIFIVVVMASVSEELLFRGVLQQTINKSTGKHHLSIWITAIIFSAIHLEVFSFLPRVLLGAMLGYFFFWTKNLWIPIFIHALNNLMGVMIMHFESLRSNRFLTNEILPDDVLPLTIVSVVGIVLLGGIRMIYKKTY